MWYNTFRNRKVLMVNIEQDDHLISALTRIADALEDNTDILRGIKKHYDGVVPVMERNAKRVEKAHIEAVEEADSFPDKLKNIFSTN
tara:strand:+ start:226 stop:486 length:261 start_codon:yes stop_codon:yes gene_type:complete